MGLPVRFESIGSLLFAEALTLAVCLAGCGGGGSSSNQLTTSSTSANVATLVIMTTSLPDALVGASYGANLTASGGVAPLTWSLTNAPSWLSIDSSAGKLAGTPPDNATIGGNVLLVAVTDSAKPQHTSTSSILMNVVGKLGGLIPAAVNGIANRYVPFIYGFQPGGGKPPFTATITAGALPPGVSVTGNSGGVLFSGTPTASGTFTYTLQVTDSWSPPQVVQANETMLVTANMAITAATLPTGFVGRSYSGTVTVVNATPPLQWYLLPSGLSGDNLGNITGIPTAAGQWTPELFDSSSPQQFAVGPALAGYLYIVDQLRIPRAGATQTRVGQSTSVVPSYTGGVPPVTFSLQSGSLPPGLSFHTLPGFGGNISGTPTQTGTFTFGVHAVDSASPPETYDEPYTITVLPPLPTISAPGLPTAIVNQSYSAQFTASGGTPPYTWGTSSGHLPPGLSFDGSGNLKGAPTSTGEFTFVVSATDSASPPQTATTSSQLGLYVRNSLGRNDSIATATLLPYGETFGLSISPYSDGSQNTPDTDYFKGYAVAGQTVNISATADSNSPLDPVIEIVDSNGQRFQTCNDPALNNPQPPVVGDTNWGNFTDPCINDDIDPGININSHLDFQVPGAAGTQTAFYLHVFDQRGDARPDMTYHLDAYGQVPPLGFNQFANGASVGVPYSGTIGATGGTGTITIQLASGGLLPAGLTINSNGQISGTPTATGKYTFSLTAADSANPPQQLTQAFSIEVANPLTIGGTPGPSSKTTMPAGSTGVAYSAGIPVAGGVPPYTYFFGSISWCSCFNFDPATGTISGIPAAPGSYTAGVNVTDSEGRYASTTLTLPISAGPLFLAWSTLPNGVSGWIYDQLLPVAGGSPPYAFTITSGAIPPGMNLDPTTGDLRGIPTSSGTYLFTVAITDAGAPKQSITAPVSITIQ